MESQVTLTAKDGLAVLYYGFVSLVLALLVKAIVNTFGRLDDSRNAEETPTSPTAEPSKEEEKPTTEAAEKSASETTEGNATTVEPATEVKAEEPIKSAEESKPEEPEPAPVDEPKVSEPVCEKPVESAPSPVKEDAPQVEAPKVVEESNTVESKEVISNDACEVRQNVGDAGTESSETPAETTKAEE